MKTKTMKKITEFSQNRAAWHGNCSLSLSLILTNYLTKHSSESFFPEGGVCPQPGPGVQGIFPFLIFSKIPLYGTVNKL
jgi:hypothetical protein